MHRRQGQAQHMQRACQLLEHTRKGEPRPQRRRQQHIDQHDHIEAAFPLFPGMMHAELLTDDLSGVDLVKDIQAHLLTHLVIQFYLP